MQTAYDLSAAINAIGEDADLKEFKRAVSNLRSATSVKTDLRTAEKALDIINSLALETPDRSHIRAALLFQAVVYYVRSTKSKATDRETVAVTKHYDAAQRSAHQLLGDLRNQVLVHFGSGDGWHDERVVFTIDGDVPGLTNSTKRTNTDAEIILALRKVLPVAITTVEEIEVARAENLHSILREPSKKLETLVMSHVFNVHEFYKDLPGGAAQFWSPESFSHDIDVGIPTTNPTSDP